MSRKSRNKGARFELELMRHLEGRGYSAMKSQQRKKGGGDKPDVLGVQGSGNLPLHVECKNVQNLPSVQHCNALAQAEATLPKDGGGVALAVHKIARKPIEDAIVTMRFGDFLALYERGGMAASPPDGTAPERALPDGWAWAPDGHALIHADGHFACELTEDDHVGVAYRRAALAVPVAVVRALLATRPPDGMPGEPECDCDMDEPGLATMGRPVHDPPAAPPTVPGEPPAHTGSNVDCPECGLG